MSYGDTIYVSAHTYHARDLDKTLKQYNEEPNRDFFLKAIEPLGFKKDDVEFGVRCDEFGEFKIYFDLSRIPEGLEAVAPLNEGDRIIVSKLFRPCANEFRSSASRFFNGEFFSTHDHNPEFIGFVGSRKA